MQSYILTYSNARTFDSSGLSAEGGASFLRPSYPIAGANIGCSTAQPEGLMLHSEIFVCKILTSLSAACIHLRVGGTLEPNYSNESSSLLLNNSIDVVLQLSL